MKKAAILFGLIIFCVNLHGQDLHSSQYNYTPHLLSPSFTGNLDGNLRVNFLHRSQWSGVNSFGDITSILGAVDGVADLSKGKSGKSLLGMGLMINNDESGNGIYQQNAITASLAFHKKLEKNVFLSAGFKGSMFSRRLDLADLNFENQFLTGVIGEEGIGENFTDGVSSFDIGLGVGLTHYISDDSRWKLGIGVDNILQSNTQLSDNTMIERGLLDIGNRFSVYADFQHYLKSSLYIQPSIFLISKGGVNTIGIGTIAGYQIGNIDINGGLGIRLNDALTFSLGGVYYSSSWAVRLLFSYDYTISEISDQVRNSPEIGISFIHFPVVTTQEIEKPRESNPDKPIKYF